MKSINSSLNIKTSHHDTLNYCYTQNNIRCYTQHRRLRSEFYSMKHKSKQSNVNLINTFHRSLLLKKAKDYPRSNVLSTDCLTTSIFLTKTDDYPILSNDKIVIPKIKSQKVFETIQTEQINTHHHKFNNKIASYFEIKRTIPSNNDTITLFKSRIDTFRRNRLIHKLIDYNHKVVKEDRRKKRQIY